MTTSRLTPEEAAEWTEAQARVVEGWWRQAALAVKLGVPEALGLSVEEWNQRLGGYVKLAIEERRDAVRELTADGLTQREIAGVLGVSQGTVSNDCRSDQNQSGTGNDPQETDASVPAADQNQSPVSLPVVEAAKEYYTVEEWTALGTPQKKALLAAEESDKKFNPQGDNVGIEWALWSWNPVTGCLHNCPYCYARDIATTGQTAGAFPNGFAPTFVPSRLAAPRNTTFPRAKAAEWMGHKNVFVCSMADLFGRWVPKEWINAVLKATADAPRWNFLFLTKFPQRMAEFTFPDNAWVGTTVDCQARVANAEKAFRKIRAGVKWLSCEPLIEPLRFADIGAFDWLVIGGASRSHQTPEWRPPRSWVNDIEAAADAVGVRVYEKDNLLERRREYKGISPATPTEAPAALRYLPQ